MCLLSRRNQLKGILRTVDKLPLPHLWNICRGFRRYGFKSWPSYFIFCNHANHNIDILTYCDKLSTNQLLSKLELFEWDITGNAYVMMIILAKYTYTIYNARAPKILVLNLSARSFAYGIIDAWLWGLRISLLRV